MPQTAPPSVGIKLRRARIERSLSIEEAAWRTRIRPDTLRALELDRFEEVGHPAFVRTHINTYARFLGVDPADVVPQFESQHVGLPSPLEELERQVVESKKPPRAKWWIAAALSAAVLLGASIAGVLGGQEERPDVRVSPPAVTLPATIRVTLAVRAVEATRITVLVDGESVFDEDGAAGSTRTFRGSDTVEILAADGRTVELTYNGSSLGVVGERGTVYRARFGPKGRLAD